MPLDLRAQMELAILRIIWDGRSKCGAGFGKYPLGVRETLRELTPIVSSEAIEKALADFDERLSRC